MNSRIYFKLLVLLIAELVLGQTGRNPSNIDPNRIDGASQGTSSTFAENSRRNFDPTPIQGSGSSVPLSEDDLERIEKERTRNTVRLAATDQLNSEIITNRTRAYLSCESGEMIVKINFTVPFRGVAYANYDRSSNCKFHGDGSQYYEMRIPLKGCGTKQEAPRLFINNIIFRFHRSLELEEDEIKTIICRYPPALAPPPADPVLPIVEPIAPVPLLVPSKLSEIELLLIICALLFLTLLLLGVGVAYYCLKRRNIKIVRKKRQLTPAHSDITKVSSIIDTIRIPRVTAPPTETSETDYPSESPSDDDGRRTIVSELSTIRTDRYRFEGSGFLPEPYPADIERGDSVTSFPVPAVHKPEITKQNLLTTIVNKEHITESRDFKVQNKTPRGQGYKKLPCSSSPSCSDGPSPRGSIPDDDDWSHSEIIDQPVTRAYVKPSQIPVTLKTQTLEDTYIDRCNEGETTREGDETCQSKVSMFPGPKILVKKIEDLYVTNISETITTESIFKETASRSIGSGPGPGLEPSRASSFDTQPGVKQASPPAPSSPPTPPQQQQQQPAVLDTSPYQVEATRELPEVYTASETGKLNAEAVSPGSGDPGKDNRTKRLQETVKRIPSKTNVILRLLDHPPSVEGCTKLTANEKNKWRTIIVTDEVFRSLIIESTSVEEYVRISRDIRYQRLFEPATWETIIRILSHPDVMRLPLGSGEDLMIQELPETSYMRLRAESRLPPSKATDTTASSRSSWAVDYDLRSITEEDVNFTRLRRDTLPRDVTGDGGGGQHSPSTVPGATDVPIKSSSYLHRGDDRSTKSRLDFFSSTNIQHH